MAKKKIIEYWTIYEFIETKYGIVLCYEEFRRLPVEEQRKYWFDYQNFIRYWTNGGRKN